MILIGIDMAFRQRPGRPTLADAKNLAGGIYDYASGAVSELHEDPPRESPAL